MSRRAGNKSRRILCAVAALFAPAGCDVEPPPPLIAHDGIFLLDRTVVALGATSRFDMAPAAIDAGAGLGGPGDAWFAQFDLERNEIWQTAIGTTGYERLERLIELSDGRIAAVGQRDVMGVPTGWMVVLDPDGSVSWQKDFDTGPMSAVGELNSGDLIVAAGSTVMRMDRDGMVVRWAKAFDCMVGCFELAFWQVVPGSDGGFLVVGTAMGTEPDPNHPHDLWLAAINADGVVEWQRRLSTSTYDTPIDATQTRDGGWVVVATMADIDVPASVRCPARDWWFPRTAACGERDWWFVKMTTRGDLAWQVSLQTDFDDVPVHLRELADGRFLVSGHTTSFATLPQEESDLWFVILTAAGLVDDQRAVGSIDPERALAIGELASGDLRVLGTVTEPVAVADQVAVWTFGADGFVGGGCGTERVTTAFTRSLPVEQQDTAFAALDQPVTSTVSVTEAATPATLPSVVCR